jgi:hypothetical protein
LCTSRWGSAAGKRCASRRAACGTQQQTSARAAALLLLLLLRALLTSQAYLLTLRMRVPAMCVFAVFSFVSEDFENDSLFATAQVYGLYFE